MKKAQYRFGGFRLASASREIWRDGQPVHLPRRVFDCILYLLENRERAIGRDELVAAVWGRVDVADTQLSQLMRRVRRALGDDGQSQQMIVTVQGYGYRWAMPTEVGWAGEVSASGPDSRVDVLHADNDRGSMIAEKIFEPAGFDGNRQASGRSAFSQATFRPMLIAGILALAIAIGITGFVLESSRVGSSRILPENVTVPHVIVLPVAVEAPAESAWVRLGIMDVVADRLRTSGLVVPPSESVVATLQGTGSDRTPSELEAFFGGSPLVHGTATKAPSGWTVALWTHAGDDIRRTAQAEAQDPIGAARSAADRLAAALGRTLARDPGEGETFDGRVARVRAALLANEIAAARSLLRAEDLGKDTLELRYWRAQTEFRAGDLDQAKGLLDELLKEPGVRANAVMHGRVLIARGGVFIRQGDYASADADFDGAVQRLYDLDESPEYAEALAGRGITRVALNRLEEAASDLGRARLQMERAGDAYGATRVDANLGLFELVRHRPAAALPYLQGAVERFESFGAISPVLSTLNAQFDAYAYLLRWPEALAVSERRWALRDRAVDPMQRYLIGVDRSRVFTALGRYREASAALDAIEAEFPDMRKQVVQVMRTQQADLAWRMGQSGRAALLARRALADGSCADASPPCGTLLLLYQRALMADDEEPRRAIDMLQGDGPEAPMAPVLLVAEAEWAAHQGESEVAGARFAQALASADEEGMPSDVALVATAYARWLLEHKRFDDAAAVAGRVSAWAEHDFDCALLQVAVLRAYGGAGPWEDALQRARSLAGERTIPSALATPPS